MARRKPSSDPASPLPQRLELAPFRQRFPWIGPDLQMLRDTLVVSSPLPDQGQFMPFALADGDQLLSRLDLPCQAPPRGLVVVIHGLGGGSEDPAQRRLGQALSGEGFAVLRLNLRGAGLGRPLAKGTYAASCSVDVIPVLRDCRRLAAHLTPNGQGLPLGAVGMSVGGTVLLNALLDHLPQEPPLVDGLVCVSSPLDLGHSADHLDRPRNHLYQRWMVRRLIAQTLADPHPLAPGEWQGLTGPARPRTLRDFDALITAPRWGYPDVGAYYGACSPLPRLLSLRRRAHQVGADPLPPLLLLHARDDPWVPVDGALALAADPPWPEVVVTDRGGHCGFHAPGDSPQGRWSDRLAARWCGHTLLGNG
ncbi:MAG: alpha/beta fold hydrolase [Cyanobacteriota bacterium]|nr:alpha/beta fold hydrolase [Cyanobacteriota bacterium]